MLLPPVKCAVESLTLIGPAVAATLRFTDNPPKKNTVITSYFIIGHFTDCTIRNYANIISEKEPDYKSPILNTLVPSAGALKYQIIHSLKGEDSTYHSWAVGAVRSTLYHHYRGAIKELSDNDEVVESLSFYAPIAIEATCSVLMNPSLGSLGTGLVAGVVVAYAMEIAYKPSLSYLETTSFGEYDPDSDPIVENSVYLIEQFIVGNLTET